MEKIRGVLFDVGETLLEPKESFASMVSKLVGKKESEMTEIDKKLEEIFPKSSLKCNNAIWANDSNIDSELYKLYYSLVEFKVDNPSKVAKELVLLMKSPSAWKVIDGVVNVLQSLQNNGICLGIISNWGVSLEAILKAHNLHKYFKVFIVSGRVNLAKPDYDIFNLAVKCMKEKVQGLENENILMVGDSLNHDIIPAEKIGLRSVLVSKQVFQDTVNYQVVDNIEKILPFVLTTQKEIAR